MGKIVQTTNLYIITSGERVWSPQCFCWLECAQCIQLNTNVIRGLVKRAQLLWTCTTGKRAQHLWNVHNISETCTYRIRENTGWGRWNVILFPITYIYIYSYYNQLYPIFGGLLSSHLQQSNWKITENHAHRLRVKSIVEWMGHMADGPAISTWELEVIAGGFFVRNLWVNNINKAMVDFSEGYKMPLNQKIAEVFLGIRTLVILESFLVFLSAFFLSAFFLSFFLASFFLPWKHNTSQHHDDAGSSSAFFLVM